MHVHCRCTLHHNSSLSHTAHRSSTRCQGAPSVPSLVSLAQSFLKPEDPMSKKFSSPGACSLHPTVNVQPQKHTGWGSVRVTCQFRIGGASRLTCQQLFADLHAAAHATCHVLLVDPRPSPSSFRRFGSIEISLAPRSRSDRPTQG